MVKEKKQDVEIDFSPRFTAASDFGRKRLLSVKESAEFLGISPRTIYNQTHQNAKIKFPVKVKRFGKLIKFDIRDLEAYVDSI